MLRKQVGCLRVLMWKHLIVRRRRYIHTPIEMVSPIIILLFLVIVRSILPGNSVTNDLKDRSGYQYQEEFNINSMEALSGVLLYSPDTEFNAKLMAEVGQQLGLTRYDHYTPRRDGGKKIYAHVNVSQMRELIKEKPYDVVIVELPATEDPDKLVYTIRMRDLYIDRNSLEYFNYIKEPISYHGTSYHKFMRLQWAIDTSFIKIKSGNEIPQKLFIQEFPTVSRPINYVMSVYGAALPYLCWLSLLLVFVFHMSRLLEERSTGTQELVRMAGVSSNLFGISQFLNVLPSGLVFSVVGTLLLKTSSEPIVPHSDSLLIFFILMLYFVSIMALAFPCSYILQGTQFTVTLSIFVYIILWVPAAIPTSGLMNKDGILAMGLLPHVPMTWLWTEVAEKETYGEGLMFSDAFKSHNVLSGSVALGALFLILQSLVMFALAWYLARVRPGQYGQALPWNFLFQRQYWSKKEVKPALAMDEEVPISRETKYFETPPRNLETGIKIENVTKIYPQQRAVSNVTLDVYKGEITVLLGHNGAGKTTLMSIITGMTSATEGRVLVNGADVSRAADEVRTQLGLCPQHNLFFADLTVLQHAMFFTLLKGGTFEEARRKSDDLLQKLGIHDKADVYCNALSGGMKRRLQLACALAGDASVLVLDEPTSGLDVETRRELWDLLLSLRDDHTVLLTTHFMEEADALGDRVAALHHGQLRCHATPMHLKKAIGTGYRLTFTTTGVPRDGAITAAVTTHVHAATLKEKTINSLSYNLPAAASRQFPDLFTSLEDKKRELSIETIGVGVSTLEEVFLKLCSDIDPTFTDDEVYTTSSEPIYNKVTGAPLYLRQFWVLLKRQFKYAWHKKFTFLLMRTIIPIILIAVFTYVSNNGKRSYEAEKPSADRVALLVDLYDPRGTRGVLYDVTGVDMPKFSGFWPQIYFKQSENINEDLIKASATDYNEYLVGMELDDTHAKALFTTMVPHAASVALNLVTNALASRYIDGADGHTIRAYLPTLSEYHENWANDGSHAKDTIKIIVFAFTVMFVFLATAINNASLPCAERASGARHIHMMSGCPALVHWSATCLFHLTLTVILITAMAVSAATIDQDHTIDSPDIIMTMVLILILGSLAFFGLTYFISWFLDERKASIFLSAAVVIFGIVTPSIALATAESSGWKFLLDMLNVIMPPHAATGALLKSLFRASTNAFCKMSKDKIQSVQSVYTYRNDIGLEKSCTNETACYMCLEKDAPGIELILLTFQFLLYMTFVILTQHGILNSMADKIFNKSYRNKFHNKESNDKIVQSETNFVDKHMALLSSKKQLMQSDQAMLVSDLHKNYFNVFSKSCNAVKGINFSVKKGDCFGLLGVNGAGKSTTFKMLTAEECATKGDIYANGHFRKDRQPYLRSLGYCPQFFGLDDFLTGRENLTLLLTLRGLDAHDLSKEVNSWIQVVGLEKYIDRKVVDYSGGCKRRIAAAAALSSGAPLTLLDEPTAGVDVSARRRVWSALQRGLRRGRAVIITSHSMDEMEALCSRIGILSGGVVRALGTPAELRAHHAAGHAVLIKVAGERAARHDDGYSARSDLVQLKSALQTKFNCTLKDEHKTMLHYHINETMRYSELFSSLEALRATYPHLVEDYSVTETTLEEVFLSIAKEQHQITGGSNNLA